MLRIKLADKDRADLGVPEWVDFDGSVLRLKEVASLAQIPLKASEFEAFNNSEDPDEKLAGLGALIWLAVRRAGVEVSWADFDVDMVAVETELVADPNPSAPTGASTEPTN